MNVPLDPIRAIACTIPGCYQSFATAKQMRRHKDEDPTHFFCKRCNVDIEPQTWDTYVEHKVEAMAPWVECRRDRRPEGPPQHIVCEFCGEDFKCFGGRLRHREAIHPAEQKIPCPGCNIVFPRAGEMIAHLENGDCSHITESEFYAYLQHKAVNKEIMKDLGEISENLQINPAFAVPKINPGLIEDDLDDTIESIANKTDGGVLLDHEDKEQQAGGHTLEAQIASLKLGDKNVPLTRSNLEVWPRLPNQPKSSVAGQVLSQSIGSPPPSIIDSDIPASQFASQITSRRGGIKIQTESYPSLQSSRVVSEPDQGDFDDGVSSAGTAKAESVLMRPAAWTTEQTPRALFGEVKPLPPSNETKSILKKRDEEQSRAPNLLLNARWWDPTSEDYTVDLFLNRKESKYCCPFPACDAVTFEHVNDIEEHLLEAHARVKFRCPGCFKIFKKAQGMMSHMESTMNCPVKKSKYFKSAVDDITGGIMRAKHLPQPAVYRSNTAVVRSGQVLNGVMSTKYKPTLPNMEEGGLGNIW